MELFFACIALLCVVMVEAAYREGLYRGRRDATASSPAPSVPGADRQTLLEAWMQTRMEVDKSLLLLSSGGIGLIATFLPATQQTRTGLHLALLFIALGCFLGSLLSTLTIFRLNATLIGNMLRGDMSREPRLQVLDWLAPMSFLLGVLALIALVGVTYLPKG